MSGRLDLQNLAVCSYKLSQNRKSGKLQIPSDPRENFPGQSGSSESCGDLLWGGGAVGDKLLIGAIPTKLLQRKRKWVELDLLMRSKPRLISQKGFV